MANDKEKSEFNRIGNHPVVQNREHGWPMHKANHLVKVRCFISSSAELPGQPFSVSQVISY